MSDSFNISPVDVTLGGRPTSPIFSFSSGCMRNISIGSHSRSYRGGIIAFVKMDMHSSSMPISRPSILPLLQVSVQGLMLPGCSSKRLVFGQGQIPHSLENTDLNPFLEVAMDCAAGPKHARNRFPLTACPHFVKDSIRDWFQLLQPWSSTSAGCARAVRKDQFHAAPKPSWHWISVETSCHINLSIKSTQNGPKNRR